MDSNRSQLLDRKTIFGWIALITGFVLLVPLIAMQFYSDMSWTLSDFVIMGGLLFTMGSLYVLLARRVKTSSRRLVLGIGFGLALAYIWAELAVGIFTNLGS